MKKNINIGATVDDGSGDYLRKGGEKINNNFDELYGELGDGDRPFPAGAWKVHSVQDSGSTLDPEFGDAWNINTTAGACSVNLPSGNGNMDYGKVIKIRDVWSSWRSNPVTIIPAGTDTVKGSSNPFELYFNDQDVELIYTTPGKWEFIDNKLINKITVSDVPTVAKREIIAEDGQTDFTDIFNQPYDAENVEVYRRGNLLYYGDTLTSNSDFGSVKDPNDLTVPGLSPLDRDTIRLREPCTAGETIIIVSYSDNLASQRTSYNSYSIKVFEKADTNVDSLDGQILVVDGLSNKNTYTLEDFGRSDREYMNPGSVEIYLNGRQLTQAGTAGYTEFECEGSNQNNEQGCINAGGTWVPSGKDYTLLQDNNGNWTKFYLKEPLENGDILNIKWFENHIGTLLDWDSVGGIKDRSSEIFMNTEARFNRKNKIRYTDGNNPSASTSEIVPGVEENSRFAEVSSFLESIYPVGTIYSNANNPNNPRDYMGFGYWRRFGTNRVLVGWNDQTSPYDTDFGLNTNDLDENDVPRHTAGGTGGNRTVELNSANIPELMTTDEVLVVDESGDVVIGSCLEDPDQDGPAIRKYREQTTSVNDGVVSPNNVSVLPPYITVHRWVRVS